MRRDVAPFCWLRTVFPLTLVFPALLICFSVQPPEEIQAHTILREAEMTLCGRFPRCELRLLPSWALLQEVKSCCFGKKKVELGESQKYSRNQRQKRS